MTKTEEIYIKDNIPIFEAMYGKGLISLGGYPAVEQLLESLNIANKHLLDIGSGIGGIAHYCAERHNTSVTGLEIHSWMVDYSISTAPEELKSKLNFIVYAADGSIPLENNSIDLVISKGVLTNIKDKYALFCEIFRVLKPTGSISIIDWLLPSDQDKRKQEILPTGEPSYKETQNSYTSLLHECGFKNVEFVDLSNDYYGYASRLLAKLQSKKHRLEYESIISSDLRLLMIESTTKLVKQIEGKKQYSMRIRASK